MFVGLAGHVYLAGLLVLCFVGTFFRFNLYFFIFLMKPFLPFEKKKKMFIWQVLVVNTYIIMKVTFGELTLFLWQVLGVDFLYKELRCNLILGIKTLFFFLNS